MTCIQFACIMEKWRECRRAVYAKAPDRRSGGALMGSGSLRDAAAYLVACTSGAGAGALSISWNCGSGRRPGGLVSLVQQQEAASSAPADTTNKARMRIMEFVGCFW